jgi:hypothetical protein
VLVPSVAPPVGADSVRWIVSAPSVITSLLIGTAKVWLVTLATNDSVPATAVSSCPAVAVPSLVA